MDDTTFATWRDQRLAALGRLNALERRGRITGISGILLECQLPGARIGDLCRVARNANHSMLAEIVGFNPDTVLLSALGSLDGIAQGAVVEPLYVPHRIHVTDDLPGSVLDGFGRAMDGDSLSALADEEQGFSGTNVLNEAPAPTDRPRIDRPLATGIRAIDGLLTLGSGQRVGLFAGAGCGKTTLLAELARNTPCDVIVFGLIGERGRELREFLDHELTGELRQRTVLVCATSDRTSMERARAAFTATAIAEAFRNQGKQVLLMLDSLTRFARAQREIGLALGEPPGRGGLPPSVYTLLPGLLERAGKTTHGAITALYSVLIEADSMNDPVADEVRSLIDGHIVLSRKLAEQGHYPAIDVLASLSRIMSSVTSAQHQQDARRVRQLMSAWQQVEMLIRLGEYQAGNDALTDAAVTARDTINHFLRQENHAPQALETTLNQLAEVSRYAP